MKEATALVFVGTSFAVTITDMILEEAKERQVPVFNFNLESGRMEPSKRLNVENIIGKAAETLPQLLDAVKLIIENPDASEE
jgi:NAD-dependent SIR2 family protein deacetylase